MLQEHYNKVYANSRDAHEPTYSDWAHRSLLLWNQTTELPTGSGKLARLDLLRGNKHWIRIQYINPCLNMPPVWFTLDVQVDKLLAPSRWACFKTELGKPNRELRWVSKLLQVLYSGAITGGRQGGSAIPVNDRGRIGRSIRPIW